MKKLFIGIDFAKEKFDVVIISALGLEESGDRQLVHLRTTRTVSVSLSSGLKPTPLGHTRRNGCSAERIPVYAAMP